MLEMFPALKQVKSLNESNTLSLRTELGQSESEWCMCVRFGQTRTRYRMENCLIMHVAHKNVSMATGTQRSQSTLCRQKSLPVTATSSGNLKHLSMCINDTMSDTTKSKVKSTHKAYESVLCNLIHEIPQQFIAVLGTRSFIKSSGQKYICPAGLEQAQVEISIDLCGYKCVLCVFMCLSL